MNLQETRAAKAAKIAEARALPDTLTDSSTPAQCRAVETQHTALLDEIDRLDQHERRLAAQEVREAEIASWDRANPQPEPTPVQHYGGAARAPGAERQQRHDAIVQALMHRSAPAQNEMTPAAREWRGMDLVEIGRAVLAAEGQLERGMTRPEVATRALQATSDFTLIMADVTNRTLRQSYAASPRTFTAIAQRRDLKDFRPAYLAQLGAAPQLLEVLENGEFKRGSMNEGAESIKLRTFGRVVSITRQVIINDDLGAFTDLPRKFGQSAANTESDVVWGLLLSNPTLKTDGRAVFDPAHNNVVAAGVGGAPSVAALAAGRTAMAKQRDPDGSTILNLAPKFIVLPTELEVPVAQLLYPIQATQTAQAVPESIRSLVPISEPRLSLGVGGVAGSGTAWYLFADPAAAEVVSYAYLEGQDGPYTEPRNGFDVDGVEVKCRHDFGAAAVDFRGAYRNAGA